MNWYEIMKFVFPRGRIPETLDKRDADILRGTGQ